MLGAKGRLGQAAPASQGNLRRPGKPLEAESGHRGLNALVAHFYALGPGAPRRRGSPNGSQRP